MEQSQCIKRVKNAHGQWENIRTKTMQGDTLYKILNTMQRKYGVEFLFCEKKDTGRRIIELLGSDSNDKG